MAVRTEDAPWIARVIAVDPRKDEIDVIWMEGNYSRQWKVAKTMVRRGRSRVSVECMGGYSGKGKHHSIWIRTNKFIKIEAGHSQGAKSAV